MAKLDDSGVRELLSGANYAVVSTLNSDGTVHNTVVWISGEDGWAAYAVSTRVTDLIGETWERFLLQGLVPLTLVFAAALGHSLRQMRRIWRNHDQPRNPA